MADYGRLRLIGLVPASSGVDAARLRALGLLPVASGTDAARLRLLAVAPAASGVDRARVRALSLVVVSTTLYTPPPPVTMSCVGRPASFLVLPDTILRGPANVADASSEAGASLGPVIPDAGNRGRLLPRQSGPLRDGVLASRDVEYRIKRGGPVAKAEWLWRPEGAASDEWRGANDFRFWWGHHDPVGGAPGAYNAALAYASQFRRVVTVSADPASVIATVRYRDLDAQRYDNWLTAPSALTLANEPAGRSGAAMVEGLDGRLILVMRVVGTNGPTYDFDVYHSLDGGDTFQLVMRRILAKYGDQGSFPTHDLAGNVRLARSGERLRLCWVDASGYILTWTSRDRGISWEALSTMSVTTGTTGSTDDAFPFDIAGVDEVGTFALLKVSNAVAAEAQHWIAVQDGDWITGAAATWVQPQPILAVALVRTPLWLLAVVWYSETAGPAAGWNLRRVQPAYVLDFTSARGWKALASDILGEYSNALQTPANLVARWIGDRLALFGGRLDGVGSLLASQAGLFYGGEWSLRSYGRGAPGQALDNTAIYGTALWRVAWDCHVGEPDGAAPTLWVQTAAGAGTPTPSLNFLTLTTAAPGDTVYYTAVLPDDLGYTADCCLRFVMRLDTGDSSAGADEVAAFLQGADIAGLNRWQARIRIGPTSVSLYDPIAAALLDTIAITVGTGPSGAFFEFRLTVTTGLDAQLCILNRQTGIWSVGAVVTLTPAVGIALASSVVFGHLTHSAGSQMRSWWREVGVTPGGDANQWDHGNPGQQFGEVAAPLPFLVERGLAIAWSGLGGAEDDTYAGQIAHTYAGANVMRDSPRISWRTISDAAAGTLILDADPNGVGNRFSHDAVAVIGSSDREILIDYDGTTAFSSPVGSMTLDTTAYQTGTTARTVSALQGSTLTDGATSFPWVAGELVDRFVRFTTGAAAGLTLRVTRHPSPAVLCFDEAGDTLAALGVANGDDFVIFTGSGTVKGTPPERRYMRLRLQDTATATGDHRIGTLVAGRALTLDVPLEWHHTDDDQGNTTLYETASGLTWSYREGPPRRTIQARIVGDTRTRERDRLRYGLRQIDYNGRAIVLVRDEDYPAETTLLGRVTNGNPQDTWGWREDTFDIPRGVGDVEFVFREEV